MIDKMIWINDKIRYKFHENILEYDMNAASLSLAERFQLLPKETIQQLKCMPKKNRVIKTGCIRRENKDFSVEVDKKLREVRQHFLEENNIDETTQLLSLHSDAVIFTSRKEIKDNIDGIQFKRSSNSTSYLNYERVEIFYDGQFITYKGIPDEMVKQHTLGMNKYLQKIFQYVEDYDERVLNYISTFQKNYLTDQLPEFFYHPFCKLGGKYKITNLEFLSFIANVVLEDMKGW